MSRAEALGAWAFNLITINAWNFFPGSQVRKHPWPGTPLPFRPTFSAAQSFQSLARRKRKEADLSTLRSNVRHGLKNEPVRIRDSSTLGRGTLP